MEYTHIEDAQNKTRTAEKELEKGLKIGVANDQSKGIIH
jgi:hypothetical protein